MKNNKIKGILWLVLPIVFLFVWFIIFGIVTIITSSTGSSNAFLSAIFPIITALLIILMLVGIGVGIYLLTKRSNHENSQNHSVEHKYAGFWKRLVARTIDSIVLFIPSLIISLAFGSGEVGTILGFLVSMCIIWLYYAFQESSDYQATLGKRALGIKVTDMEGKKISFGHATGRYFAKILSTITLFIGFMMAGFTEKKQALHDIVVDTLVVNKNN